MTDLISFDWDNDDFRTLLIDGDPWFVAHDVAVVLGMRDAADLARMLDRDEKGTHIVRTPGGDQTMTIINESGVYHAIFASRKPEAERFRKWVTGTVLPELRRAGTFSLAQPMPTGHGLGPLADVDCTRFSLALSAVSLMRKLRGNRLALELWATLGLPQPQGVIERDDDLADRLSLWLENKQRFNFEDIAKGLHLGELDTMLRRRLADMLRAMGYESRRARRHGKLGYFWFRTWLTASEDAAEA